MQLLSTFCFAWHLTNQAMVHKHIDMCVLCTVGTFDFSGVSKRSMHTRHSKWCSAYYKHFASFIQTMFPLFKSFLLLSVTLPTCPTAYINARRKKIKKCPLRAESCQIFDFHVHLQFRHIDCKQHLRPRRSWVFVIAVLFRRLFLK